MSYLLESWENHADCPKGMDTDAPTGWWCELHNVNLAEEKAMENIETKRNVTEFKITVQSEGCYNFMDTTERSIPARVEWQGKVIRVHFDPEEHGAEELRDMEWFDLAELVCEKLSRHLYSESNVPAKRLAEWLADDPGQEKRRMIEEAEKEYRIPFVISQVRAALRPLGTDARKRVLAEVE